MSLDPSLKVSANLAGKRSVLTRTERIAKMQTDKKFDPKPIDKSRLPSRHVSVGPSRAPHRSYYYAMGLGPDDIEKPFVAVASCWNESAPCNIALMDQAQH